MKAMTQEPAMTVLLGLPFHDLTLAETLDYCREAMAGDESRYLVTANVDFTTQAYEDEDLKKIVFFADRVVCDGMPLVWLSKWFGYPLRERVAGSDMVPRLLEICAETKRSVYFFGSDLDTLEEAKGIVEARYPGLKIAGMDSPPVGAVIEWDNESLCERMRVSGASLLLACLGCPKQERWIFAHHREAGIPLSIGVGASLDFITGKQKRAPLWMQSSGLEWLWRMSSSPSRLVARYRKDLVFLVKASLRQARSQLRREKIEQLATPTLPSIEERTLAVTRIEWVGELRQAGLVGAAVPALIESPVLLDASQVSFMDSSGLGRIAQLVRNCRLAKQELIVVSPSVAFLKAVSAAQMGTLLTMVDSDEEAVARVSGPIGRGVVCEVADQDGVVWVSFSRALDALYHDEMMSVFDAVLAERGESMSLVVDLREVGFIDSRAVGGLIRVWKLMKARGGGMYLAGANAAVSEIIALLRLDKILTPWKGPLPE
jgi:N-acetylglucosaminyldiphosphoundecaprenol N-acetyl-beta-D-mannosaminyltransferase